MPGDDDIYRAPVVMRTPLNVALCAIWYRLWQLTGFSTTNTPGGGIPITPPTGTLSVFAKTAGQTETIPAGAFNIGVIFLTGTGTIAGVDWPVLTPFNLTDKTAATIAVVCGSPGTARVQYLS